MMKRDYSTCLRTVNDILSNIPPFALYMSDRVLWSSSESKSLYEQVYFESDTAITRRASTSWLMDMFFSKNMLGNVPLAIHIELGVCDDRLGVIVSPFIFSYYLMFLCYHELRQYADRDRALRRLVDILNSREQRGYFIHHSLNITGHCLLLAGQWSDARELFIRSHQLSQMNSPVNKYNSARHYLQKIPW